MRLFLLSFLLLVTHCVTGQIPGCTDPLAINFNPSATQNDGSCEYTATSISPIWNTYLPNVLNETSGLVFWENNLISHNDDTDTNLYLIQPENSFQVSAVPIPDLVNKDWEDLASDDHYFYIGDFGNNASGNRTDLRIFRIKKSTWLTNPQVDTIHFSYNTQYDFSAQSSNDTRFDCEAFIVTDEKIYLFTKDWILKTTSLFELSKEPGNQVAIYQNSLDCDGLITGATHLPNHNVVVLCGYSQFLQPFIYLLYDFENAHFFAGNKRKIGLNLPYHQIEAITTNDGANYFLSNEKLIIGQNTMYAQLFQLDLTAYLSHYLPSLNTDSNHHEEFQLLTYPNPTSRYLKMNLPDSQDPNNFQVQITNPDGRCVFDGHLTDNSVIDLQELNLANGTYTIVLQHQQSRNKHRTSFYFRENQ